MVATAKQKENRRQRRKERPTLEPLSDEAAGNSKFARALGSVDPSTRNKAVEALRRWLCLRQSLTQGDLTRLWKGLFYCFWHSDLVPVQTELAERLSSILHELSSEDAFLYFSTFVATIRREWFGIDRLRLDKFLMLIRKFVQQLLVHLRLHHWNLQLVSQYAGFLLGHALLPQDTYPASGVAYHLADLIVDEVIDVAAETSVPEAALLALLEPFSTALASTTSTAYINRLSGLFMQLGERACDLDNGGLRVLRELPLEQLATQLFEHGAKESCRVANREALYELSRMLEAAGKRRERLLAQHDTSTAQRQGGGHSNHKRVKMQQSLGSGEAIDTCEPAANGAVHVEGNTCSDARDTGSAGNGDAPAAHPGTDVDVARKKKKKKRRADVPTDHAMDVGAATGQGAEGDEVARDGAAAGVTCANTVAGSEHGSRSDQLGAGMGGDAMGSAGVSGAAQRVGNGLVGGHGELTVGLKKRKKNSVQKQQQGGVADVGDSDQGMGSVQVGSSSSTAPGTVVQKGHARLAVVDGLVGVLRKKLKGQKKMFGSVMPHLQVKVAPHTMPHGSAAKSVPSAEPGSPPGSAGLCSKSTPKSVHWGKNMYLQFGEPVPPADVRTPPSSTPKGSALKKEMGAKMSLQGGIRKKKKKINKLNFPAVMGTGY